MSVEPQLERSVLERKERDELQTIARALGLEPTSRARKAELVDLILGSTGATAEGGEQPAPERKTRRRSTRATATNGEAATGNGEAASAEATAADAGTPAEAAAQLSLEEPPGVSTNGNGVAPPPAEEAAGETPEARRSQPAEGSAGAQDEVGEAGTTASKPRVEEATGEAPPAVEAPERPDRRRDQESRPERPPRGDRQQDGQGERPERPPVDEGESGNRRRRRRGRDRDRGERPEETFSGEPVPCAGLLDLRDEGYGFIRTNGYLPSRDDVYVSVKQVRQYGMRKGDHVEGASRAASRNEKNPALLRIDRVNGKDPELARQRPRFEDLTPLFPDEKLRMETGDPSNMTARIIDLISPIGKGQRGLIVSPPKAGKTTVMKQIAKSIEQNNPEVHLMVLLVDERPEEVTDMRRTVKSAEVIASTFDRPSDEHTQVTELAIERAKRMVEEGADVVIILDGITRLARAYNLAAPATGRIMSGGVDSGALYPPKRFFGAARNLEEGGSLTILGTALVETGSKMDEVIFEEFKGTGNMELRLDRRLAERRIYPALDVEASSTRHEELLFDRKQLQQAWRVRRALSALAADGASVGVALERLMDGMKQFKSNDEFLAEAAKTGGPA